MSFTLSIQDKAPDFILAATDGRIYSIKDFSDARICRIFYLQSLPLCNRF